VELDLILAESDLQVALDLDPREPAQDNFGNAGYGRDLETVHVHWLDRSGLPAVFLPVDRSLDHNGDFERFTPPRGLRLCSDLII
jgi:hypothetical protein